MKRIAKITALLAALVLLLPVTRANADVLYEATTLNSDGGALNATSWPSLNKGMVLVDDITVPASGWTINEISNFFSVIGSPTVSNAYLIVFPKSLGQINPYDYKTEVPVTMTNETFIDPTNGQSRDTYKIDAAGLSLQLGAGDYWIGLSPIANDESINWMAWGSSTTNGEKAISYDMTYQAWMGTGFWTGPDFMMKIEGAPSSYIPVDVAINAITSPVSGDNLSATETVTAVIKNVGAEVITSGLTLSFKVDSEPDVTQVYTGSAIQPGTTTDFTFTQKANLSTGGAHFVKVTALLANDGNSSNNSFTAQVNNAAPMSLPLVENFETGTFPPFGWLVNNPDNQKTWVKKNATGNGNSSKAACVEFYNYSTGIGAKDELVSPVIPLTNVSTCGLTFNVAYCQYQSEMDELKVFLSTDSGSSFNETPIYDKSGDSLATTEASQSLFMPTLDTQWRLESLDLSSYIGSNIVLKFESTNAFGNNLYIDDIKVDGTVGIEHTPLNTETVLAQNYPNPFNPTTHINFKLLTANAVELSVYNSKGELVQTLLKDMLNAGEHSVEFDGTKLNSGLYFYKLTTPEKSITNKMLMVK